MINRGAWSVVALALVGCSPSLGPGPVDLRVDAQVDVLVDTRSDAPVDTPLDAPSDAPSDASLDGATPCESGACRDAGGASDVAAPDVAPAPCRSDAACAPTGQVCDRDRGVCVACRTRADCAGTNQVCTAQRCVAATTCTSSRQCPGQVCHPTLGLCADCSGDADCDASQQCRDATCVARPRACQSSRQCFDLGLVCEAARMICVECAGDHDCAADTEFCNADNRCAARVCAPGAARCAASGAREVCDARGSGYEATPCGSGQTCRAGTCIARLCAPGASRCAPSGDNRREVCDPDGLGYTASPCGAMQTCAAGACAAWVCTPGGDSCESPAVRRRCNADGLGYTAAACAPATVCLGATGVCVPTSCSPGSAVCASPGARSVCNADGQGRTDVPCGATEGCRDGVCSPRLCAPGGTRCASDGTLETCAADGLGWAASSCAPGQSCSGGACRPQVCIPGATACGGASRSVCNADGLGFTTTPCAVPANASATCAGAGVCGFTCDVGFGDCNAGAADGCETTLSTSAVHCGICGRACPSGATCVAGACATVAPSAPRLVAPLSTAAVSSRRPALRWALAPGSDGARVQLCRDRACAAVLATLDVEGTTAFPTEDLPTGVLFWRAFGRSGAATGTESSATWEMFVGPRSAPVNTSSGSTLDVNGDGYADLAVGAPSTGSYRGRVYVFHGGPAGLAATPATTINGPAGDSLQLGQSTASAGDVNGDGYADLLVTGTVFYSAIGAAFVYLGGPTGVATTPSRITGSYSYVTAAGAGDVNGDGYGDVILGTTSSSGYADNALIFLGSATGLRATAARTLSPPESASTRFGTSVAGAGDMNGDGYADVIVGAPGVSSGSGAAYVYAGSAAGIGVGPVARIRTATGAGGSLGQRVAGAGDTNGDGFSDLVIMATGVPSGTGRSFVYLGPVSGEGSRPAVTLDGSGAMFGSFGSHTAAGDLNGDGYSDLAVSAVAAGAGAGQVYVFLGSASGPATPPAVTLTGPDGARGNFGAGLAIGWDLTGDGYADLAIGASGVDSGVGRVYVHPGNASGIGSTPAATFTGLDGASSGFGASVARAGAVNSGNPFRWLVCLARASRQPGA